MPSNTKAAAPPQRKAAGKPPKASDLTKRLDAMGKASRAKAADGDRPVQDYIAGLPPPYRGIVAKVDALAEATLPGLQRGIKWGMAYYGVGDGWCFACGAFDGHVKVAFMHGTSLAPEPPVAPVGMGKATRCVELASARDIDEAQLAAWMRQAAALPGFGKR